MEEGSCSLEGIELLQNASRLTIRGINRYNMRGENLWPDISGIDFSPLSALKSLKRLSFLTVMFNEIPDFGNISSLDELWFEGCIIILAISGLTSLNYLGISGSNYIDEEWESTVIRTADFSELMELRHFRAGNYNSIDLGGILG